MNTPLFTSGSCLRLFWSKYQSTTIWLWCRKKSVVQVVLQITRACRSGCAWFHSANAPVWWMAASRSPFSCLNLPVGVGNGLNSPLTLGANAHRVGFWADFFHHIPIISHYRFQVVIVGGEETDLRRWTQKQAPSNALAVQEIAMRKYWTIFYQWRISFAALNRQRLSSL